MKPNRASISFGPDDWTTILIAYPGFIVMTTILFGWWIGVAISLLVFVIVAPVYCIWKRHYREAFAIPIVCLITLGLWEWALYFTSGIVRFPFLH